jgi:hypothetical protein
MGGRALEHHAEKREPDFGKSDAKTRKTEGARRFAENAAPL